MALGVGVTGHEHPAATPRPTYYSTLFDLYEQTRTLLADLGLLEPSVAVLVLERAQTA